MIYYHLQGNGGKAKGRDRMYISKRLPNHTSLGTWHIPQLQLEMFCAGPVCKSAVVIFYRFFCSSIYMYACLCLPVCMSISASIYICIYYMFVCTYTHIVCDVCVHVFIILCASKFLSRVYINSLSLSPLLHFTYTGGVSQCIAWSHYFQSSAR